MGVEKKLSRQHSKANPGTDYFTNDFFSPIFHGPENQIKVVTHFQFMICCLARFEISHLRLLTNPTFEFRPNFCRPQNSKPN